MRDCPRHPRSAVRLAHHAWYGGRAHHAWYGGRAWHAWSIFLLLLLMTSCSGASSAGVDQAARVAPPEVHAAATPESEYAAGIGSAAGGSDAAQPGMSGGSAGAAQPATSSRSPDSGSPASAALDSAALDSTRGPAEFTEARLTRLTTGGCCTQPFWSADSRQVMFIDRPAASALAAIWSVDIDAAESPPQRVADVGYFTADMAYRIEVAADTTTLVRLADGERWTVPSGGRPVSVSPGRTRIAWSISNPDLEFERRTSAVWVAGIDGSAARSVATLPRGGLTGWLSDDVLLLSGRDSLAADEDIVSTLSVATGTRREIVRAPRLRGTTPSPDGSWLVYYVSADTDPAENGTFLVRVADGRRQKLPGELFGAYRWRDGGHLLIVPLRSGEPSHQLVEIANGDWTVSPDGRYVAFVEGRDDNIWLIDLPGS